MRRAFSLAELLVVIAIIVLALALAVPALNLLTGAKSAEQTSNLITTTIAQARGHAVMTRGFSGVLFFQDSTNRIRVAMVSGPDDQDAVVNLNLVPDVDSTLLPTGIVVETVDDSGGSTSPAIPRNDRYLGFNSLAAGIASPSPLAIKYGGVILFDKHGHLASRAYSLQASVSGFYTAMGVLLYATPGDSHLIREGGIVIAPKDKDVLPVALSSALVVKSQVGFVILNEEMFANNGGSLDDSQIAGTTYATGQPESNEEDWIDNNSMPFLINHYNGSTIKGE